jgi:DNA-binding NarL/FixJ family response regulator
MRESRDLNVAGATRGSPEADKVHVVLVAGVRLYREGLAAELRTQPGLRLVGLAADFDTAVSTVRMARPDVVLLDARTPRTTELVRAVRETHALTLVIAFAVDESERDIELCAEAGVTGFVTRDVTVDGLVSAIRAAVRGELTCSPRMAAMLFQRVTALSTVAQTVRGARSLLASLTKREREIAAYLAGGSSNKEIGRELHIEITTVKNHVHHILQKLQVTSRSAAAARVRVVAPADDRDHRRTPERGVAAVK